MAGCLGRTAGLRLGILFLSALVRMVPAQGQGSLWHRIDSLAARMYYNTHVDTNYVARPDCRWILELSANVSGAEIEARGIQDGIRYESELRSAEKETFSLSVAYRGFAVGVSLNPAHMHGRDNDFELNLSSYGNRIGGEIVYHSAKTFSGSVNTERLEGVVNSGLVDQTILSVNGYYVFNHRRFSYPAAFARSYLQLRSAGSWMLGLSFWKSSIEVGQSEALGNEPHRMRLLQAGAGGGYGYNFVPHRRWLLHLSALSAFVVYGHNRIETDGESQKIGYRFPEVIITGRGAVVYRFANCFAGMSMVTGILNMGDPDKAQFVDSKWQAHLFWGICL